MADTLEKLQAPIRDYYASMKDVDTSTPRGRIRATQAIQKASLTFRQNLSKAIDASAVLATGGVFTGAQRSSVIDVKTEQNSYAVGFMYALTDLTEGQALARAASYLPAVLHVYSMLQIHDVPTLPIEPGDGQTECGPWCKCTLRVEKNGYDFNIYWLLHPAEHCTDCITMNQLWNPLRIRNGVIIDQHDYSFLSGKSRKMVRDLLVSLMEREGFKIALSS